MLNRPIVASMWRPWDSPPYDRYAPPYTNQSYVPLGASEAEVRALLDRPKATSWIASNQGFVMHLKPGIVRSNSEHSACTEGFTTPEEKSVRTDRVSWVAYGAQFRLPEVHPSGLGDVIALNAQFQVHEAKDPNFLVIVSAIRYMDNSAILQVETRASGIVAQVPLDGTFAEVHFLHDSSAGNLSIQHDGQQLVRINRVVPSVAFRVNVGRRANTQVLRQGFVEVSLCSDLRWLTDPIEEHWRPVTYVPMQQYKLDTVPLSRSFIPSIPSAISKSDLDETEVSDAVPLAKSMVANIPSAESIPRLVEAAVTDAVNKAVGFIPAIGDTSSRRVIE